MLALCSLFFHDPSLISVAAAGEKDVQILQSDGAGIIIEYRPHFFSTSKVSSRSNYFDHYDFEGYRKDDMQVPGSPEIGYRSILLRLNGTHNNSVDIINSEYEDVSNVVLQPVAAAREGEIGPERSFNIDPSLYNNTSFMPVRVASLAGIGETRGTVLGELRISPLQYNAASRVLRKYTRIVVRVNFGNAEHATARSDKLVNGLAINDLGSGKVQTRVMGFKKSVLHTSVLSSGVWYRLPVTETGMYKLTGAVLLAAGIPANTDPQTIRIFGNGGYETPASPTAPYVDDLLENAVYVNDGGTAGHLDPGDFILFYGKGTRGWTYDGASKTFSHYINHFTEVNFYWLTYGGQPARKMTSMAPDLSVPFRPATARAMIFREDDKVNLLSSGREWVGQSFNVGDQMTYVHPLFGLDVTQPINYKFHIGARSSGFSNFSIREHNTQLLSVGLSATIVGDYFSSQFKDALVSTALTPTFSDLQSQLRFTFTSSSSSGNGYIDWYEIQYQRSLIAQNEEFAFTTIDTTASAQYAIQGFPSDPLVFDVTRFDSVVIVPHQQILPDTCLFQIPLTAGLMKEIYVVGAGGFKTPGPLTIVGNQNLHGDPTEADYIIITPTEFMPAAQRLRAYREQPGANSLRTLVVDVAQIYNEFGGGLPEPAAVRNYLRYVYTNWSVPPKYVLLFGDGDYDYKRIIAKGPNWILPWETTESFYPLLSYASDDDYVTFDAGRRVALGVGRLTARSLQEANTMVDKIVEYETMPIPDPWKERITFVADDGLAGAGEPNNLFLHTGQAEALSNDVPAMFEERKIYEYEYPTIYTPGGRRKPEVNIAIHDQINQGTLVLNFTGHGNPRLWTHEAIFVRETDFPFLHNKGKYFILVAATCNYGYFDATDDQSGGELLVSMPDAGAIAGFYSNRVVFAGDNFDINQSIYRYLFRIDSTGRVMPTRLGDVIYRTKQDNFGGTADNDRKFYLLGDPALSVGFPKLYASIDSINKIPPTQTAQLQALGNTIVNATVRDTTSQPENYSGSALIAVYDSKKTVYLEDFIDTIKFTFSFSKTGNILFKGEQTIDAGKFAANFIVPKDISYSNDFGRITLYFWNPVLDGAGYSTNFRVGGTDTTAAADTQGPTINLFLDKRSFRSGDVVSLSPLLIADIHDEHGVNTSGAGIGHRLEAWLDDKTESIDLSEFYTGATNTYKDGTVQYRLSGLTEGTHRLRMRAWDTYNNSTTQQTVFDVVTKAGLQLSNLYNYPNPFSSSTVFTFRHNQVDPVDAEVKIYTVAGRLIQSVTRKNVGDAFVQIPWDGRDKDGDAIANGVYLYKIIVTTESGRLTGEALGKLSVQR